MSDSHSQGVALTLRRLVIILERLEWVREVCQEFEIIVLDDLMTLVLPIDKIQHAFPNASIPIINQ